MSWRESQMERGVGRLKLNLEFVMSGEVNCHDVMHE